MTGTSTMLTSPPPKYYDYRFYGIAIRSEIPLTFPEVPGSENADVTFSATSREWFLAATAGLANLARPDDWYERRQNAAGADFLHFPDLFDFMVSSDGRTVAFAQLGHSTAESFETYLLGHVLSYALVKQQHEPLHATTVVIEGAAVAFLGSSGQGKSTLAAAFVHAGHQVLTDDLLVVRDVNGTLCGFSGPPRLKLFPHVAEQFLPQQVATARMNPDTEKLIIPLEGDQVHAGRAPIRAFVVLDEGEPGELGIQIRALNGRDAVLQLLGSTFNARLVTPERLRRQFLAARAWAERVDVQRLVYPRTFEEIELVREAIVASVRPLGVGRE